MRSRHYLYTKDNAATSTWDQFKHVIATHCTIFRHKETFLGESLKQILNTSLSNKGTTCKIKKRK